MRFFSFFLFYHFLFCFSIWLFSLFSLLVFLLPIISLAADDGGGGGDGAGGTAQVFYIDGPIGPATASFVQSSLETAQLRNAEVIIIAIDTPGGLVDSMRTIIRSILNSPIPIVTYVFPSGARAASAGTYILYASHIAAMAPATNLGAATPVQIDPGVFPSPGKAPDKDQDTSDEKDAEESSSPKKPQGAMEKKMIQDAVAFIRSLAQLRSRNADWAEKAVTQGASLPVSEALELNVIDLVATDINDLLKQLDGWEVAVGQKQVVLNTVNLNIQTIEPSWRIKFLSTITNPNIVFILMLIGIYGVIFEFSSPGSIGPGIIGVICLLFGLYALNVLPLNFTGLVLLILGLALMVVEAFIPSFGILGVSGLISFVLGAAMLFDPEIPGFNISWKVIGVSAVASGAFLIFVLGHIWKAHRRPVITGNQRLIGRDGKVLTWSSGRGFVLVGGERWRALGAENILPGDRVEVKTCSGLELSVEKQSKQTLEKG